MAVTTIHQIKSTLNKAVSYITNPEKTNNGALVSSYNCQAQSASIEMEMTRGFSLDVRGDYKKVGGSEILAHHLIQSFSPDDEITPELAHELGKQLIDELTEGKFEYVISTHVDQEHIHNHIIFNSVSFYDLKKFRCQPYRTANKIKEISNRICAEHNLSVSPKKEKLKDSYKNYSKRRNNTSFRSELRKRLTMILDETTSWEAFEEKSAALEITVNSDGKHITFALEEEGQQRKTRGNKLDDMDTFTKEGILNRLTTNQDLLDRLEKAIEDTFFASDSLNDFIYLLNQDYNITIKQNKDGSSDFLFNDVSDTRVKEVLLPDSFHLSNFENCFRTNYKFTKEYSLEPINDRYREKEKSVIVQQDTPITLLDEQIEKVTKDGLLVRLETDETEGLFFIASNYVDVNENDGSYTIWLNDKFDYTIKDQSTMEDRNYSIKGEGIIRGLEIKQGLKPEKIVVAGKNIQSISERGVSLSIPSANIERIFIPSEYVSIDQISQAVTVAIGKNWNYYGQEMQVENENGTKKRANQKFTGSQILSGLEKEVPLLDVYIQPKLTMLKRRSQRAHTDKLLTALNTIREEKIATPNQIQTQLAALTAQKVEIENKISVIDKKIKNYNQVAKLLITYEKYLPIVTKLDEVSKLEKISMQKKYKNEIQQFRFAEKKLLATDNLRHDLTKEKIISMAKNQTTQRQRLVESYRFYEEKLDKLIAVQETIDSLSKQGIFDYSEIEKDNHERAQDQKTNSKRSEQER